MSKPSKTFKRYLGGGDFEVYISKEWAAWAEAEIERLLGELDKDIREKHKDFHRWLEEEGRVVVEKEPSAAMIDAGISEFCDHYGDDCFDNEKTRPFIDQLYRAMIAPALEGEDDAGGT